MKKLLIVLLTLLVIISCNGNLTKPDTNTPSKLDTTEPSKPGTIVPVTPSTDIPNDDTSLNDGEAEENKADVEFATELMKLEDKEGGSISQSMKVEFMEPNSGSLNAVVYDYQAVYNGTVTINDTAYEITNLTTKFTEGNETYVSGSVKKGTTELDSEEAINALYTVLYAADKMTMNSQTSIDGCTIRQTYVENNKENTFTTDKIYYHDDDTDQAVRYGSTRTESAESNFYFSIVSVIS